MDRQTKEKTDRSTPTKIDDACLIPCCDGGGGGGGGGVRFQERKGSIQRCATGT